MCWLAPFRHHCNKDEEIFVDIWIGDQKLSDSDSLPQCQITRNALIFSTALFSWEFYLLLLLLFLWVCGLFCFLFFLFLPLPCPTVFVTLWSSLCFCLPGLISLPLLSFYTLHFLFSFPHGWFFSSSPCEPFFSGLSLSHRLSQACLPTRHLGWRGAFIGRESWWPGDLQVSKEKDGGRGRQEGALTGIQAGLRRWKKIVKEGWEKG